MSKQYPAELTPEEYEGYYHDICFSLLFCQAFNRLGGKAESGEEISHAYTVQLVERMCESLARKLELLPEKAKALAKLKGLNFPPFGAAGLDFLRERAAEDGFALDEATLGLSIAAAALEEIGTEMREDLRLALTRLYLPQWHGGGNSEEDLVNLCYALRYDMYILEQTMEELPFLLTTQVEEEVVEQSILRGELSGSHTLERLLRENKPLYQPPPLTARERSVLNGLWAHYQQQGYSGLSLAQQVIMSMEKLPTSRA